MEELIISEENAYHKVVFQQHVVNYRTTITITHNQTKSHYHSAQQKKPDIKNIMHMLPCISSSKTGVINRGILEIRTVITLRQENFR